MKALILGGMIDRLQWIATGVLITCLLWAIDAPLSPVLAQTLAQNQSPPSRSNQAAPYDQKLTRLAIVLGRLHFLSGLCKPDDGTLWRARMIALLSAEQPSELRQKRLIASFNQGYSGYSEAYQRCTDNAERSYQRELASGRDLAQDINNRYGK